MVTAKLPRPYAEVWSGELVVITIFFGFKLSAQPAIYESESKVNQ